MPWPVHPVGFFGGGDQDTYKVERSLRFNSADSAYLSRTPGSAGNRKTWTWSGWVKLCNLDVTNQYLFTTTNASANSAAYLYYGNNKLLYWDRRQSADGIILTTNAVLRDPSAWYHIVLAVNYSAATNTDRAVLYINGIQQTYSTATYPNTIEDSYVNAATTHYISASGGHINAYLTEINFIDGQALTPSSFGETDAITGRWKAKAYSGTYGTNGFYLKFADNSGTTSTTLGKDSSGNGNNWTPNNFSVTAGAGNDSLLDSPTNSGTSGNYCTINPLKNDTSFTVSNGNLDVTLANEAGGRSCAGSISVSSGKWYWEATITANSGDRAGVGIASQDTSTLNYAGFYVDGYTYEGNTGNKINNNSGVSYGSTFTTNDTIGVALDMDVGSLVFYKNGVSQGTAYSGISGSFVPRFDNTGNVTSTSVSYSVNFGQRPFAYTAPTGFKALCTTNLPQPTIQKPSKYMDVVAYTGTGASNSISSLGFSPDLVWIKNRGTTTSHAIYDTTRGTQAQLSSDTTGDEVTSSTGLTAFGSNGFTVGTSSLVNTSGTQYVAWAWDEAPIAGMDIVSYTGNGANRTIAHNLGVAPKMMIVKARATASTDQGWPVYHTGVASDAETDYLLLNSTAAAADLNTVWNDTAPTSSVFSVGTNALVNTNNDTYIAYLFAEVEGFSKFGSYTGNGSADGPFVWCGFRPRWVMYKDASSVNPWVIMDTTRQPFNVIGSFLLPNAADAESSTTILDAVSNGFKVRVAGASVNTSGNTIIFAAFAESPFKYARAR